MGTAPGQPLNRLRLLAHSLTSILDQAWLSALNLALGLVLIRWASKADYGLYAQLYVAGLFAVSVTESVIINPLTTLAPRLSAARRARFLHALARYQRRFALALSVAFGGLCGAVLAWQQIPQAWVLALAFGVYVLATALREFQRGLGFLQGQPGLVLRLDAVYGLLLVAGIGLLIVLGHATLPAVLGVLAVANGVAWCLAPSQPVQPHHQRAYRVAVQRVWQRGRLGLPGALSSWLANYSYLYLAAAWLGVVAAADLNAARLLLMPISLLVVAWSRVARPQLSHCLHQGRLPALQHLLVMSALSLTLLSVLYLAVLWCALPWLQRTLLGPEYAAVHDLVLPWGIYFVLYTLHLVGAAVLLSADHYPKLLLAALSSLPVLALALAIALPAAGAVGAVYALIVVEVYNLALLSFWFLPALWRQLQRPFSRTPS